ncbi:uncharacterized protein METZ01_LOCUS459361, partial [marine metagenome]
VRRLKTEIGRVQRGHRTEQTTTLAHTLQPNLGPLPPTV